VIAYQRNQISRLEGCSLLTCPRVYPGAVILKRLFLLCPTFGSIWQLLREWIGVLWVDSHNIPDHLLQFTHMTGGGKARRSFMQLICLLCAWVV